MSLNHGSGLLICNRSVITQNVSNIFLILETVLGSDVDALVFFSGYRAREIITFHYSAQLDEQHRVVKTDLQSPRGQW